VLNFGELINSGELVQVTNRREDRGPVRAGPGQRDAAHEDRHQRTGLLRHLNVDYRFVNCRATVLLSRAEL
jgi:hypothetical protein